MRPSEAMENEVSSSSMVKAGLSSCWAGATPEKKRQEVTQRTRRRGRTRQELTQSAQRRSAQRTRRRERRRRERRRRERRKREKNGSKDPPLQRIDGGLAWIMVWGGLRRKRGSRDPLWECSP